MIIRRPQTVWSRPLKFDAKEFLKAISKGALSTAMADAGAVRDAAIDGAASIGLERHTVGELAWELLSVALQNATRETFAAVAQRSTELTGWDELLQSMQQALDATETPLNKSFFSDPAATHTYRTAEAVVVEWADQALGTSQAEAIGRRLRSQFVHALYAEWHAHPARYAAIENALSNPFDRPAAADMSWRAYHAWLEAALDEPLFDEPFGLRDVYVTPTGTLKSKPVAEGTQRPEGRTPKSAPESNRPTVEMHLPDVVGAVVQWANSGVARSPLLVISGGPGSGKSSLAKIAAARCAHESTTHVLNIPLHMLELDDSLEAAIRSFAAAMPGAPAVVLTADRADPLILIFDGLDELVLHGRSGFEAAQTFLAKLERMLSRLNADRRTSGVLALLTCREILVQGLSRVLDDAPLIEIHNFTESQRYVWWANYGRLKNLPLDGYPDDLAREDINELTVQPLLNHLIAFAYTNGRIDFSTPQTLNSLYGTVLRAVYDRVWAGRRHVSTRGLTFEEFVLILGEIALCTWWGDGRTASEQEVRELCVSDGIEHLLPEFETAARSNMLQLLTAFYFRYTGAATERMFEFTHKTFAEYLVVKRIVGAIADIARALTSDDGKSDELGDVFVGWFNVCGPHVLDDYMLRFLESEIALVDKETCSTWATALARLLQHVIFAEVDIVCGPGDSYQKARTEMRTAEETLVTVASAVAAQSGNRIRLHAGDTLLTRWIAHLRGEPVDVPDAMFTGSMAMFDLSESTLNHADLHYMNLTQSWFERAELMYASFVMSECIETSFEKADLTGAAFTGANLISAVLRRAKLHHVIFNRACLWHADASDSIFFRASFIGADLGETNFERTDFIQCDFSDANLENTRFAGARFTNCIRNERAFDPSRHDVDDLFDQDRDSDEDLEKEEPEAR